MSVGRFAGAELGKFMGTGVKFGELGSTSRSMQSQQNAHTSLADSAVAGTQLTTEADIEATKLISEAQAKLGVAQSQASGMSGLMSGIAGGIGSLGA